MSKILDRNMVEANKKNQDPAQNDQVPEFDVSFDKDQVDLYQDEDFLEDHETMENPYYMKHKFQQSKDSMLSFNSLLIDDYNFDPFLPRCCNHHYLRFYWSRRGCRIVSRGCRCKDCAEAITNPFWCCYFERCPLRHIFFITTLTRIVIYGYLYTVSKNKMAQLTSSMMKSFLEQNAQVEAIHHFKISMKEAFTLIWLTALQWILIVESILYLKLFSAALLLDNTLGKHWFATIWLFAIFQIVASTLILCFIGGYFHLCIFIIVIETIIIYDLWLWKFYKIEIEHHGGFYNGQKVKGGTNFGQVAPINSKDTNFKGINENIRLKSKLRIFQHWDDTSYSEAERCILSKNKYQTIFSKKYEDDELEERLTGLKGDRLETEIQNFIKDPTKF